MTKRVVFPGTFSPPTYGHVDVVCHAAEVFPEVIVVCSSNPDKGGQWFSPEECVQLWSSYHLPTNVGVTIFEQAVTDDFDGSQVVMVRGLRDQKDVEYEKSVMTMNHGQFGINQFFYVFCDEKYKNISSTMARQAADCLNFQCLAQCVSPLVVTSLLERVLFARNLFMVVGRPGSGKSTLIREVVRGSGGYYINTDDFNHQLKYLLRERFGNQDLIQVALEQADEIKAVVVRPWLKMLADALQNLPKGVDVFVEVPYGFQQNKQIFRFLGGKVICVDCSDDAEIERRVIDRGTSELLPFIRTIPDMATSRAIAKENRLSLVTVGTNGSLIESKQKASQLAEMIRRTEPWKMLSPEFYWGI